mmetsp:Transcript_28547/g.71542  ORF Transcript_28547/g.71542 Transcript_28547/m.71542 type:complete len:482 (+) Transcript_28547:123-1568(+)
MARENHHVVPNTRAGAACPFRAALMAGLVATLLGPAAGVHPTWDISGAPNPCDHSQTAHPCGFRPLQAGDAVHGEVYRAAAEHGTYNHAAMIDFHDGFFLVTWKNAPRDEEQPGQRVLYATSDDGIFWTPTDGTNVLFPNVSTTAQPAHLFAAPSVVLEGRRYAVATYSQYSIHPSPLPETLLLRRVYPDKSLGEVFWATDSPPAEYLPGAAAKGIRLLRTMDGQAQSDAALLRDPAYLPCGYTHSLKCEAIVGEGIPKHESAHWHIPGSQKEVAMFRHRGSNHPFQWMHRDDPAGSWSGLLSNSNFPDHGSNLNAGTLPSGATYVLSNACPKSWAPRRDPLVVSLSRNGFSFTKARAITTCHNAALAGCEPRFPGSHKDAGPSYPQGVTVVGTDHLDGLYVVFTNNKEDVWVVKIPYSALELSEEEEGEKAAASGGEEGQDRDSPGWLEESLCAAGQWLGWMGAASWGEAASRLASAARW